MNKINLLKLVIMLLLFFAFLNGCMETGENQGSNKVILNGSLLKGVLSNAEVSLLNSEGIMVWQGTTDANGAFNAEFSASSSQLFTLVGKPTVEGQLQCDATECLVPLSSTRYQFGDFIPGSELGELTLKSALYLSDEDDSANTNGQSFEMRATKQINTFSTLLVNLIEKNFDQSVSKEEFQILAEKGSKVVIAALGIELDESINILDIQMPDVNQPGSINDVDPLTAILGLINASQSMNISFLAQFSDALALFVLSPTNESAKGKLADFQQMFLLETQKIIESGQVTLENDLVNNTIAQSLDNGINFTALSETVDTLSAIADTIPNEILASSTYWGGGINPVAGQWWWVSASDPQQNEWVQVDYNAAFLAAAVEIGLNNDFHGNNARIEGSNDGQNWVELVAIDAFDPANELIDERNVRHLSFSLNQPREFRQYRFYFEPPDLVWLEYLCIYNALPPATGKVCENSEVPINTLVSSFRLAASNIDNFESNSWWLSELGSGREEWLQVSFPQSFPANRVYIVVKQSNQGDTPTIQGSHDGENWTIITELSLQSYPNEWSDELGFRHIELALNNDESFKYYRYHAKPSSFIWLQNLNFSK